METKPKDGMHLLDMIDWGRVVTSYASDGDLIPNREWSGHGIL